LLLWIHKQSFFYVLPMYYLYCILRNVSLFPYIVDSMWIYCETPTYLWQQFDRADAYGHINAQLYLIYVWFSHIYYIVIVQTVQTTNRKHNHTQSLKLESHVLLVSVNKKKTVNINNILIIRSNKVAPSVIACYNYTTHLAKKQTRSSTMILLCV